MSRRGNGEGTIYYSEKLNRWVGQFTNGKKTNGKLNRKTLYGNTRKEVKEKITKALSDVQSNQYIEKNNITLIEIINKCIEESFQANKIKETTYKRNLQTKKIIEKLDIAYMPIQKINRTAINSSLTKLVDYSNSSIEKTCILIRQGFNYAMLNEIISKDPFLIKGSIIKPISSKQNKEIEALEVDEQKLFLNELKKNYDKYTNVFYIAIYTGMRIGEILSLNVKDLNFEEKTISVNRTLTKDVNEKIILGDTTKTYAGIRTIPILSPLLPILDQYKDSKGFLFLDNKKFIASSTINAHFKRICKNANIKVITTKKKKKDSNNKEKYVNLKSSTVNTHMLRHTFATRCIEAGMNPAVLQKILGHKDIQVTLNTYTSIFNKYKEKEIEKVETYLSQLH